MIWGCTSWLDRASAAGSSGLLVVAIALWLALSNPTLHRVLAPTSPGGLRLLRQLHPVCSSRSGCPDVPGVLGDVVPVFWAASHQLRDPRWSSLIVWGASVCRVRWLDAAATRWPGRRLSPHQPCDPLCVWVPPVIAALAIATISMLMIAIASACPAGWANRLRGCIYSVHLIPFA